MGTRLTIDLGDPQLLRLLRHEAADTGQSLRDIVIEALTGYFSGKRENIAIAKLAESAFAEWDNPKDAEYDSIVRR